VIRKDLVNEIISWDVRSWSKALAFWDSNVEWTKVSQCLELGGAKGGLSLWLAVKGKNVLCTDLTSAEYSATPLHQKHKVMDKINYSAVNALEIPFENHFDIIVFKSIIGGIGRNDNLELQLQVFNQVHKALKPGGKLLFAENLKGSLLHQFMRKNFVRWGNSWRYPTPDEIRLMLKPFKNYNCKISGVTAAFGRSETQRRILAVADDFLFNPLFPDKYKYIVFGVAEK
jgi:2-polyprenyl-3-methyl-5-hydroxy-6-metoxy-1,4-benzoquinol methylase